MQLLIPLEYLPKLLHRAGLQLQVEQAVHALPGKAAGELSAHFNASQAQDGLHTAEADSKFKLFDVAVPDQLF